MCRLRGVVCFLLLLMSSCLVWAQESNSAAVSGVVKDPTGAVVANASIVAKNTATNSIRSTKSNGEGFYALAGLPPGEYEISVKAPDFSPRANKLTVEVGQRITWDVALRVGPATAQVEVTSAAVALDTTSSVVDAVVDSNAIENLPLNGRNYLELALLIPGNSPAPNFDPTKTNTVQISSAGQLGRGGNVTVDGADNNDDVVGGALHNVPQDAVREFQMATNRFSAELGRSGSSVINVVTKSGSNQLHGSASIYERDAVLQGLPATLDRTLGQDPSFSRQQYSGTLGGPIVRDRAWWFAGFEYRKQDGVLLVGERNLATNTIDRVFADAPVTDLMFTPRADWQVSDQDNLSFRYSLERVDAVDASSLVRTIGSASERQDGRNDYQAFAANWTRVITTSLLNRASFSVNNFVNHTDPVTPGPQLTFPSVQDGASFRVPQATWQNRLQFSDSLAWTVGRHSLRFGAEVQRVDAAFDLRVFQSGRIELVEDFASQDRNGDGVINDLDLLFAVTLRSAFPDRPLLLPDADNNFMAFFVQDDWRIHPQLTLNLGLRYELDTDVKNISRVNELNPIILPFLHGTRGKDTNNWGPRIGFNWSTKDARFSIHGGYGIYYDRITLEISSLERGLDGRALPIVVRAGNVFFLNPDGTFAPGAPTTADPFTGFPLPGAGAAGINIIDNRMQSPAVQQFNLGFEKALGAYFVAQADFIHNLGTHFIIGRPIGTVFNPVVGGPDVVKNLESSVNTHYDALLLSVRKQLSHRYQFRASYTFSKAFNYENDDQIPFGNGPIEPNNLRREYGPTPNDQRHRFVFSGTAELPYGFRLSPIWTMASGVPMDILLPDASGRVPEFRRNAGGTVFHSAAELNAAITIANAGRAPGDQLPLVSSDAKFNDSFHSFDMRLAKTFKVRERVSIEGIAEVFNLFNVTNILGVSNQNYSGFNNVLGPSFGRPVTTAGGVLGSGGPRAFQLGARLSF
ncbi:MAG: TonB-dependent receptor [Acidobacteriota bacterium]|nr:TonB-dependent receptor [Acidobacteriota bacterium]